MIGSHVADGAVNAGKSIEVLWLSTIDERPGMILSAEYDAHQINKTGKKASGASFHKLNINPDLGKYLTLIHTSTLKLGGYGMRKKVYDNVRK